MKKLSETNYTPVIFRLFDWIWAYVLKYETKKEYPNTLNIIYLYATSFAWYYNTIRQLCIGLFESDIHCEKECLTFRKHE